MFDLNTALRRVIETDGSDLHLKVPSRPLIRRLGHLEPIPDSEPLTPEDTERVLRDLLNDELKLSEFTEEREVDFSFSVPGLSRFRVNAFQQRGVISLVCRAVPHEIKTIEALGLPEVVSEIADEERGIIDCVPPHLGRQLRGMLAGTLKAVISQRLASTPEGTGRVACCEILRMTGRVQDMIMNPEESGKLSDVIAAGSYYGMQTFDQA